MSTPSGHSAATHSETSSMLEFANALWRVRRPRPFMLVIEGEVGHKAQASTDDLHDQLLLPEWRVQNQLLSTMDRHIWALVASVH